MLPRRDSEDQLRLVRFQRDRELRQAQRERLARRSQRRRSVRRAVGRSMVRIGRQLAADPEPRRAGLQEAEDPHHRPTGDLGWRS